jgi:hypothetical protein
MTSPEPDPIELKDGSIVYDPRLDRLKQFDEKSRAFPVRMTLTAEQVKKPRGYTWGCPFWFNQGREGRCVEYGIVHEAGARPALVKAMLLEQILADKLIYWPAQREDQWPGGSYPGATPKYEGTSVLAGVKVAVRLGLYKEYRWAFGLDDLILAVGYKGPAILGVDWYEGMFDTDDKGFIHVSGGIAGGHAILCNGVSVSKRAFRLHNSWGKDWGVNGEAWLSFADMEKLLHDQGEACIPSVRLRPEQLAVAA